MKVTKAVITAAAPGQRTLPLQTLIDQDGVEKSVLGIILEEVLRAEIEEICVVVCPGDEATYRAVSGDHAGRLRFVHQSEPLGYGHALIAPVTSWPGIRFSIWLATISMSAVLTRDAPSNWLRWPPVRIVRFPPCKSPGRAVCRNMVRLAGAG